MRVAPSDRPPSSTGPRFLIAGLLMLVACGGAPMWTAAATADEAWDAYLNGDYEAAATAAQAVRDEDPRDERAWQIEIEALTATGKYDEAYDVLHAALQNIRDSLRLRLMGLDVTRFAGRSREVDGLMQEIRFALMSRTRYVRDIDQIVALGEAALLLGVEPRLALENFLRRGREFDPPARNAFLAIGRLALSKGDAGLASRTFQEGIAAFPNDPDMWYGLAASFLDGDRAKLLEYANQALELNPNHVPSRVLLAEHMIDAEEFSAAEAELDRAAEINPYYPDALALRAALAQLGNDPDAATRFRGQALNHWRENPRVDYLIGRKLSQRYRFVEGASFQRRALVTDPSYTPARIQLAQDLLRLGRDEEGWALAGRAHEEDAYDITAYNLVNLRDKLDEFTTLRRGPFRLRMGKAEAPIYGDRALDLLETAAGELTARYGVELPEEVTVEIYPSPNDFAVRTFGMPGNPGYLGVCFGPVITVNSPSTRRANWEAVLWHEFTHVITLTMTRNRMPRWLSEGISVYEELERNPAWGQLMSLDYRDRILTGRTQPISQMSAAFLQAESGEDVQFAYYQSYLVVDFLVAQFGFEALRAVLTALGGGVEMNTALADYIAPLDELDDAFARHAREKASALGGPFDLAVVDNPMSAAIAGVDPNNFAVRLHEAREAMEKEDWDSARATLEDLTRDGLYLPGAANAHAMLARVARELKDTELERAALTTITEHESDAVDAIARLLAIANEAEDWDAAAHWADYWLAVNPMATTPWRTLLAIDERRGHAEAAVTAGRILLKLEPPDRAAIHYRVAKLLQAIDIDEARLHVLEALEDAPRFRDAHVLLSKLPAGPGVNGTEVPAEPEVQPAAPLPVGFPEALRPSLQ